MKKINGSGRRTQERWYDSKNHTIFFVYNSKFCLKIKKTLCYISKSILTYVIAYDIKETSSYKSHDESKTLCIEGGLMEVITRKDWYSVFREIAELMISNKDLLSQIDAKFGDGDHGITIEKIAHLIEKVSDNWINTDADLKALFSEIGTGVTNINGGSAGPLYGTYFGGLGEELQDETEADAALLKVILKSGLTELQYLSNAKVGDKTMMDTLIPATEAALAAPDDIVQIVTAAKEAALQGAKDSENYISKFGRARSYKEKTIGTPDAGAQSCTYIFTGLYNVLTK